MKNRNGKKEKMPANRSKNPGSSLTAGVATAVPATRPGTPTRAANPFAGTKPGGPGAPKATGLGAKAPTGPATDHTEGARLAQEAIRKDPSGPGTPKARTTSSTWHAPLPGKRSAAPRRR